MTSRPKLVLGTRGSPLALAQAELTRQALVAADPALAEPGAISIRAIRTTGDAIQSRPLAEIGGKGLFTKEIEEALLAGTVDLAVHSLKDMPTVLPEGLVIAACLARADPRDALISRSAANIAALPEAAVVGTASLRRAAQLLAQRSDLQIVPLRGNVQTRLAKLDQGLVQATLLARAGLDRLGLDASVPAHTLATDEMLPAVAQGIIGIEARVGDRRLAGLLAAIDHAPSSLAALAERTFLAELDGSCRTPIAGLAAIADGVLAFRGLVATPDGRSVLRVERQGAAAEALALGRDAGRELARRQLGP